MPVGILLAVALVPAVTLLAAPQTQERTLREAIAYAERGLSALTKGNATRARESLERAVAYVPDLPEAHLGLGHLAMRERRFEDALREYTACEAAFRTMTALRLQLESERYARSRDALQRLRTVLAQLERESQRNQMRGAGTSMSSLGLTGGQVERERAEIQTRIRALESMPAPAPTPAGEPPAEVYFFQGNALFDLNRIDEAIVAWEAAAKRNANLPLVQNNLAVAYWKRGRLPEARAAMGRAEALGFRVNPSFRAELARASGP